MLSKWICPHSILMTLIALSFPFSAMDDAKRTSEPPPHLLNPDFECQNFSNSVVQRCCIYGRVFHLPPVQFPLTLTRSGSSALLPVRHQVSPGGHCSKEHTQHTHTHSYHLCKTVTCATCSGTQGDLTLQGHWCLAGPAPALAHLRVQREEWR